MNSWNSFKEHHELKSDRYEEDQNIIIKLHSFEYIKGYIDKDEAKEFDYQLFYPIIRIPKRFFYR